jgi:hypothetical protein
MGQLTIQTAVGSGGGVWSNGGSASSLLDGISNPDDGKAAVWTAADSELRGVLTMDIDAPASHPSSMSVVVRAKQNPTTPQGYIGGAYAQFNITDAVGSIIFRTFDVVYLDGSLTDYTFDLVQILGSSDRSGNWSLEMGYFLGGDVEVAIDTDLVEVYTDGSGPGGGSGGSGPGGQKGLNASFFLGMCGPPV